MRGRRPCLGVSGGIDEYGIVFELSATGQESILFSFPAFPDGAQPAAGVVGDSDGNLYGVTIGGGAYPCDGVLGTAPPGCGTVFKLTSTGKETLLYSFAQALTPRGDLFRDAFGNLGSHDTSNGREKSLMVVRPLAGATPVVPPVAIPVLPAAVPTEVLVYEGFTVAVGK